MQNPEQLSIANGGIQVAIPESELAAIVPQIIYLDFDGEQTSYHNQDLNLRLDEVIVEDSGLTEARIATIVRALNDEFTEQNVVFVTERPTETEYSTIFVGKTSSFDEYGSFAGLAETVDIGNHIKNDNAIVMLDSSNEDSAIVKTISHEARHLIGTLEHDGEGIGRYADGGYVYYYYLNNQTYTGSFVSSLYLFKSSEGRTEVSSSYQQSGGNVHSCIGYRYVSASNAQTNGFWMYVSSGGVADHIKLNGGGIRIYSSGVANYVDVCYRYCQVYEGGLLNNATVCCLYDGIYDGINISNYNFYNAGNIFVDEGGVVSGITVNSGGLFSVRGTAYDIVENGGWVGGWGGWGRINTQIGGVATFVPNVIEGLTAIWSMTLHSGTTANSTTLNSGGFLVVFSGGLANSTTVNRGGCIKVSSGGIANNIVINVSDTVNLGPSNYILNGGTANNIIVNSGGIGVGGGGLANNTILHSGCSMVINGNNGMAINTIVSSGGIIIHQIGVVNSATISSGGILHRVGGTAILEGTILLGGQMVITSATTDATNANIIFDLTQRTPDDEIMIDNYYRTLLGGEYGISVTSDQQSGTYRLAGGASNFNNDVALTVDGSATNQTFIWQDGQYNTITIGGKQYSLVKSNSSELCLEVSSLEPKKISFDFSIDSVGQIEYYAGPGAETFTGTALKVPYLATATVTLDKDILDGEYSFAAFLDNYDGARRNFQIQVENGIPEYVCVSQDVCFVGEMVAEDSATTTWHFAIEDYFLTDTADSNMPIGIRYEESGSLEEPGSIMVGVTMVQTSSFDKPAITVCKEGDADANKKAYISGKFKYETIDSQGSSQYTISINPKDTNNDYIYDKYSVSVETSVYPITIEKEIDIVPCDNPNPLDGFKIEIPTVQELKEYDIVLSFNLDNGILKPHFYKKVNGNEKECPLNMEEFNMIPNPPRVVYDIKRYLHCGIATAANMLYKGGYLPQGYSAQKCFEDLSDAYFFKVDGNQSKGRGAWEVFKDFGLNYKRYYNSIKDPVGVPDDIRKGLLDLGKSEEVIVAAIDLDRGKDKYYHEITCLSVTKCNPNETIFNIHYSDSDMDLTGTKCRSALLYSYNGKWYMYYMGRLCEIVGFTTLIGRSKEGTQPPTIEEWNRTVDLKVYSKEMENGTTVGSIIVVNGSITDAVVETEGILEIASGAVADTLNIHTDASVIFDSGSIVKGNVLTYGGTISVSSGANVSEAEIDFNLVNLTGDNDVILDNLLNAQAASFTVTVGSEQATGRYYLANVATGFDGSVTVCGATYGDYSVRPGFVDGELGTLVVGETLDVANQLYKLTVEGDTLVFSVEWASLRVLSVESDVTFLTEGPVTVTAVFSEDITLPEYSLDNEHWEMYVDGVAMSENGFVWFRGTDAEGNQSDVVQYEVYNIYHNESVDICLGLSTGDDGLITATVSAEDFGEGIAGYIIRWSTDGENFTEYGYTTENQLQIAGHNFVTYYFQVQAVDAVGLASVWSEVQTIEVFNQETYLEDAMANSTANSGVITFDTRTDGTVCTFGGNTIGQALVIQGNGTDNTSIQAESANMVFANGNEVRMEALSWSGIIYGGAQNENTDGASLAFQEASVGGNVFGGGRADSGSDIAVGEVSLALSDCTQTAGKAIYGGAYANGGTASGESVSLELTNVQNSANGGNSIYGGGAVNNGGSLEVGDVETVIAGGVYGAVYNGANIYTAGTGSEFSAGTMSLDISGGTFTGAVGNGSTPRDNASSEQGPSTLDISGGLFEGVVYGGAASFGGTGTSATAASTSVVISGGTFNGKVYGGNVGQTGAKAANTTVTGDASLTVDCSANDVCFNGNVTGASMGAGTIGGDVTVTFTGDGGNLHFGENSFVSGDSEYAYGKTSYVEGCKTLVFDDFSGVFSGNLQGNAFDTVSFGNGAQVNFQGAGVSQDFHYVTTWNFELCNANAVMITDGDGAGNVKNNFFKDTINIAFADDAEAMEVGADWTVYQGQKSTITNWNRVAAVTIDGITASGAKEGAYLAWSTDEYKVYVDANYDICLAKLA